MSDTRIDFLYLSEPDMIAAGVTDMARCVLSLIHISEPTRLRQLSRMPSSA